MNELQVLDETGTIFNSGKYVIPLYQRAYAWEDKQLTQMIEDIKDIPNDGKYYMGSLIVARQRVGEDIFEVVDGQQRLTSMFLLLNTLFHLNNLFHLEIQKLKRTISSDSLSFACRDKSNYTLVHIKDILENKQGYFEIDRLEEGIKAGAGILFEQMKKENDKEHLIDFVEKLERVVLYRIEVPEHTDLNRYFEIMNTRGEQLEQHDILKATLMSYLKSMPDKEAFAKIWNACSDMTGYVQMHFFSRGNEYREGVFGRKWNSLPSAKWQAYKTNDDQTEIMEEGCPVCDIIKQNFNVETDWDKLEDGGRVRFESVIEFPYFLLHTLKVFISQYRIIGSDGKKIVDELIDDKKLIDNFDRVVGYIDQNGILDKNDFAKEFIICLLRTRFLFDKYIIKREFANEDTQGEWSLKSLDVSGDGSSKKPFYKKTWIVRSCSHDKNNDKNNESVKENIMLQSALRVSYTSPKIMHWITQTLIWLTKNAENKDQIESYTGVIEEMAKEAVSRDFLNDKECIENNYAMGVKTPHIVFNYLDYLIWKSDKNRYKDFVFEFRNSVEHWYPQHPSDGFESWKEVDQFGNLCIVQRKINSKFSNMPPEGKKSSFKAMIDKGSLKLRLMRDSTENNQNWKSEKCVEHGKEMLDLLRNACGLRDELRSTE